MIHFMLDDLCGKTGKAFFPGTELFIPVADRDGAVPPAGTPSRKRQAALLGFVGLFRLYDFRIVHRDRLSAVKEDQDRLGGADHIGRHAGAFLSVRQKRIPQILCNGPILPHGRH